MNDHVLQDILMTDINNSQYSENAPIFLFSKLPSCLPNGKYEFLITYDDDKENQIKYNQQSNFEMSQKLDSNHLLYSEVNKKVPGVHYAKSKQLSIIPEDNSDVKYLSSNFKDSNYIETNSIQSNFKESFQLKSKQSDHPGNKAESNFKTNLNLIEEEKIQKNNQKGVSKKSIKQENLNLEKKQLDEELGKEEKKVFKKSILKEDKSCFGDFFKDLKKTTSNENSELFEKRFARKSTEKEMNALKEHIMRTKKSINISNNQLNFSKKIDSSKKNNLNCSIDSDTEIENVQIDLRKNFTLSEITDNFKNTKIPKPEKLEKSPRENISKNNSFVTNSKTNISQRQSHHTGIHQDKSFQTESRLYDIIKNNLDDQENFYKKTKKNLYQEKSENEENTQIQESSKNSFYNVKAVTLNLEEDSNEKTKKRKSVLETAERLLKTGEEYRNKRNKLEKIKIQEEMKNCSFSPNINKEKRIKNNKSVNIIPKKEIDKPKKDKEQTKPEKASTTVFLSKKSKNDFISKNIESIKRKHKELNKSKNPRKSKKIIKEFIEPTFQPKINRKSVLLAENYRKNSLNISAYKKSSHNEEKLPTFKANEKSEQILRNRILSDIFDTLIELEVIQDTNEEYGFIELDKIQVFAIFYNLHFFPFDFNVDEFEKYFEENNEDDNNREKSTLGYNEEKVSILINAIFEHLGNDNKNISIKDLTIFILSVFGLYKEEIFENEKNFTPQNNFLKNCPIMFKTFKKNRTNFEIELKKIKKDSQFMNKNKKNHSPEVEEKKEKLARSYRKKILEKAADYIKRGLINPPKNQNLRHTDFLILKQKIKEVELQLKRKEKEENCYNECTFKPLINESQISMNTLHYNDSNVEKDFEKSHKSIFNYQKKSAVLKLELKITNNQKEKIYLYANDDIDKKMKKIVDKYSLGPKKTLRLKNLLKNQLKTISE